jgi:polyisoprenoid-binding protein YceI
MKTTYRLLPLFILTALSAQAAEVETYEIDPVHSSIKFSIRHFVAKTTGNFGQFEGTLEVNRSDLTKSSAQATIQIPSVDTDNEKRDAHLQEDDYFGAAANPVMTFTSTDWAATDSEDHFKVTGDLSFNGVTKPVTLEVELLGFGEGMRGAYLSGWEAKTTIDRTEWGVDGGQPAVGNEVDITINIEAIRQ